jgi:hypothetical protein
LKSRAELEAEWEFEWEELVADSQQHYFYCRSTGQSVWSIPHARKIKFISNSPLYHQWAADMRKQGFEPEDKPAAPAPSPTRRKSLEKASSAASSLFAAVKSGMQSAAHAAVAAVSHAVHSRSNSLTARNSAIHPPSSPFLLSEGSRNVNALAFCSARHAGSEPTLWFDYLVSSLLSTGMDEDIALMNPFLLPAQIPILRDITVSILFHTNRIGQINRCLIESWDLLKLLRSLLKVGHSGKPAEVTLKQALVLKATTLASGLATKRHYLREVRRNEKNIPVFGYDPRYCVFEFSDNIILRDSQVSLIDRFVQTTQIEGRSMCTQMMSVYMHTLSSTASLHISVVAQLSCFYCL